MKNSKTEKKPTKKSCETRRKTRLYFSKDKNCRVVFYSKTKPDLIDGKWMLDIFGEDRMVYVGNRMKDCLGGDIDIQECEMAEVDIAVRIRIYDAEGNLKKV